jgi:hypothetical protein
MSCGSDPAGNAGRHPDFPSRSPTAANFRCCDEIRELAVSITHDAYRKNRLAGFDGTGEISLRNLVKFVRADFHISHY